MIRNKENMELKDALYIISEDFSVLTPKEVIDKLNVIIEQVKLQADEELKAIEVLEDKLHKAIADKNETAIKNYAEQIKKIDRNNDNIVLAQKAIESMEQNTNTFSDNAKKTEQPSGVFGGVKELFRKTGKK